MRTAKLQANGLLSAAIGKAALRVITDFEIEVHASRYNCREVEEYLPLLAKKYKLTSELVEMQWRLLPIRVHHKAEYRDQMPVALSRLAGRDADEMPIP